MLAVRQALQVYFLSGDMAAMDRHLPAAAGLWDSFQNFIISKGISAKYARFHIIWVKRYVRFNNNEIPPDITDQDIRQFSEFLATDEKILPWQLDQALTAVSLFRNFLKSNRSVHIAENNNVSMKHSFKDTLLSGEAERADFRNVIEKVRREIRLLHYSIRTEQTYVQWIGRFLAYHRGKSLNDLSASDIKEYLEYLAVDRTVSSSTQNQALNAIIFLFKKSPRERARRNW